MKLLQPVHCIDQLNPLLPVINTWPRVLEDYISRSGGDLPFWYRERSQIGLFAISAWLNGWAVLEEWGTKKGLPLEESHGRNDLWIGNKEQEWFIEAKHTWCDIHKGKSSIQTKLKNAKRDAIRSGKMLQGDSAVKVAAVFVSPAWQGRQSDFEKHKKIWIDVCQKELEADAVALVLAEYGEFKSNKTSKKSVGATDEVRSVGSALLLFAWNKTWQ